MSDDTPLAQVYNRLLAQVESYGPLLDTAESISEGFDFYAGVIWPEIASALSEELGGVIFAAGRPDDLHKVSIPDQQLSSSSQCLLQRLCNGVLLARPFGARLCNNLSSLMNGQRRENISPLQWTAARSRDLHTSR